MNNNCEQDQKTTIRIDILSEIENGSLTVGIENELKNNKLPEVKSDNDYWNYKNFKKLMNRDNKSSWSILFPIGIIFILFIPLIFPNIKLISTPPGLFYASLIIFGIFLLGIYFIYRLKDDEFQDLKNKVNNDIDKKLECNYTNIKNTDSNGENSFVERKLKFIDICLEPTTGLKKRFIEISVGIITALIISIGGFSYDAVYDLAMNEDVTVQATDTEKNNKSSKDHTENKYTFSKKEVVFSITSYLITFALIAVSASLIIFCDLDCRYYYLKILESIKIDTI